MTRALMNLMLFCLAMPTMNLAGQQSSPDSLAHWLKQGEIHFEEGDFANARIYFIKAQQIVPEQSPEQVDIYNNLGNIAGYLGQPEEAIHNYQEALKRIEFTNDPIAHESSIKKNIAATYSDLKDFTKAFKYLQEAEKLARRSGKGDLIADCLNNKGILYEQTDSIAQALAVYSEAKDYYRSVNDIERLALVNVNIGVVAKTLGQNQEAILAYDSALYYAKKIPNAFYEAVILNNQGNLLSELGQHQKAIDNTQKALSIARNLQQMNLVQNCLESLSSQYASAGNYPRAYEFHIAFNALKDSLINEERIQALSEMETKYEVEKKNVQLVKLETENLLIEKEKTRLILYLILLAGIIVTITAFIFIRQRIAKLENNKKALELIAQTERQERERIAKDMHDELGSGISRITWITASAIKHSDPLKIENSFYQIEEISVELAQNMRSLIWLLNTNQTEWTTFVSIIREMTYRMSEEKNHTIHIADDEKNNGSILKSMAARDLMLIIKESVHNAIKYADAQEINIRFAQVDQDLELIVSDNGKGFDLDKIEPGQGLQNIRKRIEQLQGRIQIDGNPSKGAVLKIGLSVESIFERSAT
jgi:signal transduction histidine kinase